MGSIRAEQKMLSWGISRVIGISWCLIVRMGNGFFLPFALHSLLSIPKFGTVTQNK
jgi:hypothetical protein